MYDMLQLDFGRGENLGDVEMGLLESGVKQVGSVVAVARGVGSGFDQSTEGGVWWQNKRRNKKK